MSEWILIVVIVLMGQDSVTTKGRYDDKASCYEALKNMRIMQTGEKGAGAAFCRPVDKYGL